MGPTPVASFTGAFPPARLKMFPVFPLRLPDTRLETTELLVDLGQPDLEALPLV